jgi:uridylate kinase
MSTQQLPYKRILLKMSGGVLMSKTHRPLDPVVVHRIVAEVKQVQQLGIEVGIVIGGGNFFRGAALAPIGIDRITADYMGMMGTLINALALRDAFEKASLSSRIFSAISISGIAEEFHQLKAIHHLKLGRIVIFAGGTGNPLVTTDSAASLRGIEIRADAILKATDVDGVYSSDPDKDPSAKMYTRLTYDEAIENNLGIMDLSAFCQCRDYKVVLKVFNMTKPQALLKSVLNQQEGTTVTVNK